ncbi:hypothetical protein OYC64_014335 [Pagothenia borchgrevinki]|uniref:Toll-like receptor 3 n=1 Tax=Pagothenia borchgrevinki TaxID=8213 RepID=A0ABD2H128_PAGBO
MASLIYWLFSVAFVLGAVQMASGYSYSNCIEKPYSKGTFQCINRKETKIKNITKDLPSSTINLTISNNYLGVIPDNSFGHLQKLEQLRLDHNNITTIGQSAFENLPHLTYLNLSFNQISVLNPAVFKDLHNLTFLSLTNNTLKRLPGGIFLHSSQTGNFNHEPKPSEKLFRGY